MSPLAQIEKVLLLRGASPFSHCNGEAVVRIATIATERDFDTGATIYERGDPADALYLVVSGKVELEVPENGDATIGPRHTFGVHEILSGRLRVGDARAAEPTVALAIPADDFFDLLSHDIEIVKALFREVLAERDHARGSAA